MLTNDELRFITEVHRHATWYGANGCGLCGSVDCIFGDDHQQAHAQAIPPVTREAFLAALAMGAFWRDAVLEILGVDPFEHGEGELNYWRGQWKQFWKEHGG